MATIEVPKSEVPVHQPAVMVGGEKIFYRVGSIFVKQDKGDYAVYPSSADGTRLSGPAEPWTTDPRDATHAVSVGKVAIILGMMATVIIIVWLAIRGRHG
jgi:hypothetical protein